MDPKTSDQIDDITTHLDEVTEIVEELRDDSPASVKAKTLKKLKTSVRDAKAAADKLEDQQETDADSDTDDEDADDDDEDEGGAQESDD